MGKKILFCLKISYHCSICRSGGLLTYCENGHAVCQHCRDQSYSVTSLASLKINNVSCRKCKKNYVENFEWMKYTDPEHYKYKFKKYSIQRDFSFYKSLSQDDKDDKLLNNIYIKRRLYVPEVFERCVGCTYKFCGCEKMFCRDKSCRHAENLCGMCTFNLELICNEKIYYHFLTFKDILLFFLKNREGVHGYEFDKIVNICMNEDFALGTKIYNFFDKDVVKYDFFYKIKKGQEQKIIDFIESLKIPTNIKQHFRTKLYDTHFLFV